MFQFYYLKQHNILYKYFYIRYLQVWISRKCISITNNLLPKFFLCDTIQPQDIIKYFSKFIILRKQKLLAIFLSWIREQTIVSGSSHCRWNNNASLLSERGKQYISCLFSSYCKSNWKQKLIGTVHYMPHGKGRRLTCGFCLFFVNSLGTRDVWI